MLGDHLTGDKHRLKPLGLLDQCNIMIPSPAQALDLCGHVRADKPPLTVQLRKGEGDEGLSAVDLRKHHVCRVE